MNSFLAFFKFPRVRFCLCEPWLFSLRDFHLRAKRYVYSNNSVIAHLKACSGSRPLASTPKSLLTKLLVLLWSLFGPSLCVIHSIDLGLLYFEKQLYSSELLPPVVSVQSPRRLCECLDLPQIVQSVPLADPHCPLG